VQVSGNNVSFIAWMVFSNGLSLPIVALASQSRQLLLDSVKVVWKPALVVSPLSRVSYAITVWAFSQERIAPVPVLQETCVLFAMLILFSVIKELFFVLRILIISLNLSEIALLDA
jgi:hypothetical protein